MSTTESSAIQIGVLTIRALTVVLLLVTALVWFAVAFDYTTGGLISALALSVLDCAILFGAVAWDRVR